MKILVVKGKGYALLAAGLIAAAGAVLGWGGARTVAALSQTRDLPVYSVETPEKKAVLGINCAWDNGDIPLILKTLEEKGVKATFFILGEWCDKYPESVRQIARAGHEIASHSNTHRDLDTLSEREIREEVASSMEKLAAVSGQTPRFLRPPSGAYNSQVIAIVRDMGYCPVQWSCDSLDWQGLTAREMTDRLVSGAHPGMITLLHSGAEHTAQALPQIIDALEKEGYSFVTAGELILEDDYWIDHTGRQHPGAQK